MVTKIDAMTCKIGPGAYHNDDADYKSDLQKIFPEKNLHLIDDVLVNAPVSAKTTFDSSKTIIKNRRKLNYIKVTFLQFTKKNIN